MLLIYTILPLSLVLADKLPPVINRQHIVQSFNPIRNHSSADTPLQVGNGNFAFGVDVTGLQTFSPFATLSTWGWHNDSLPTSPGQTDPSDFEGVDWWTHGRLVNYNQPNEQQPELSTWLRENPSRINLARIGFNFGSSNIITENALENKTQTLHLWTGTISSSFVYDGVPVHVETLVDPDSDTVAISVDSDLLRKGKLGIFIDFPYPTHQYFEAPFVGAFNATSNHSTSIVTRRHGRQASIEHIIGNTSYSAHLQWGDATMAIARADETSHRYLFQPRGPDKLLQLSVNFSPGMKNRALQQRTTVAQIKMRSQSWWEAYWRDGAFLDLTATETEEAMEIQKRVVLSLYLLAVNSASSFPPQESGLVNNGWFGKFHMEMIPWHLAPFARWNHWSLFQRSLPRTYNLLLTTALARARRQGYKGARWGKMTDPFLGDAPGEINSLLIWQQPHPMYLAELEYRSFPTNDTLKKWHEVLVATAEFMVDFAWWNSNNNTANNALEGCYELGPPMYPVSENTNPNVTRNPTFELAYWRFGIEVASDWHRRQSLPVPDEYANLLSKLCPLPVDSSTATYPIYEGIPDMWTNNETVNDHPAMLGIFGLLPPPKTGPPLNATVLDNTFERVRDDWDIQHSYGWDFPLLAMNALRLGNASQAIGYLLHESFPFDDAGYPIGGTRVPTPYFPSSGGLLLAVAMMAGGWDGKDGGQWPEGWNINAEGFTPSL